MWGWRVRDDGADDPRNDEPAIVGVRVDARSHRAADRVTFLDLLEPGPDTSGLRAQLKRVVAPMAGLCITLLGLVVIHRTLGSVTLDAVSGALSQISAQALGLGLLCTLVSFAAIGLYDLVAVETVAPGRLPRPLAAATGAAGYAVSNALGFPLLTQAALRYRLYGPRAVGIEAIDKSWLGMVMSRLAERSGLMPTHLREWASRRMGWRPGESMTSIQEHLTATENARETEMRIGSSWGQISNFQSLPEN